MIFPACVFRQQRGAVGSQIVGGNHLNVTTSELREQRLQTPLIPFECFLADLAALSIEKKLKGLLQ